MNVKSYPDIPTVITLIWYFSYNQVDIKEYNSATVAI